MSDGGKARNLVKFGCLGMAGVFSVLLVIGAMVNALTSPEERARMAAETKAEEAAEAAKEREAAARKAKDDGAAIRQAFAKIAIPCEAAQLSVVGGLQGLRIGGDRVALAQDVSRMQANCTRAWLDIEDIVLPDDLGETQEELADKLVEECKLAFRERRTVAENLLKVVDGDMRPSVMAGLEEDMAAMQRAIAVCDATLNAIAPPEEGSARLSAEK